MLGMCGKKASMERQNSNGLIKNFKRECQSENVSKALRITVGCICSGGLRVEMFDLPHKFIETTKVELQMKLN